MSDRQAPSHLFVLLGATGDLSERKLLPAMYRLSSAGLLNGRWAILGVARNTELDDDGFRHWARQALREAGIEAQDCESWCEHCLHYHGTGREDVDYSALAKRIEEVEEEHGLPGNRVFYLALPPPAFIPTVEGLGDAGLNRSEGWTRLVLEKPIGNDLESARQLHAAVHRSYDEKQIYRIDHYLGKETVQNLLVFRFGNQIFESLWNSERVDNVQITVAEDIGTEGRAGYYDRSGALRDMVQNHLTQLMSLIAMEVPVAYDADSVRHEKIKVLRSIERIDPDHVVFGQYGSGGGHPGYREDAEVAANSQTETFVALRVDIDTWRWQGVPFYLRTGKRLPRRVTEVAVTFRRPPVQLFESMRCADVSNEALIIRIQPDEGFELYLDVKRPGEPLRLERLPLRFEYGQAFGDIPDAYVTLLLDVLQGDQTLFVHREEADESWRLYTPLLDGAEARREVHGYAAGSWGPSASDALLRRFGHQWLTR
jgi:glucose-6-phosphate 1-dehydrogenase